MLLVDGPFPKPERNVWIAYRVKWFLFCSVCVFSLKKLCKLLRIAGRLLWVMRGTLDGLLFGPNGFATGIPIWFVTVVAHVGALNCFTLRRPNFFPLVVRTTTVGLIADLPVASQLCVGTSLYSPRIIGFKNMYSHVIHHSSPPPASVRHCVTEWLRLYQHRHKQTNKQTYRQLYSLCVFVICSVWFDILAVCALQLLTKALLAIVWCRIVSELWLGLLLGGKNPVGNTYCFCTVFVVGCLTS